MQRTFGILGLAELLYPTRCALCDWLGDRPICLVCEASFDSCDDGPKDPDWRGALDAVVRMYRYEGRASQAVQRLKYARATALARPMAQALAAFGGSLGLDDHDLILPVPIHWSRRCYRGFNQSLLLCEGFERERIRSELLRRVRATRQQVGLTPEERRKNLAGAFWASPLVSGKSILLVDDVVTSGHTMEECARALKAAGSGPITGLAFAGG